MKTSRDLVTDIQMSAQARALIDNPVFESVFKLLEQRYINEIVTLPVDPANDAARNVAVLKVQCIKDVYRVIKKIIDEGTVSQTKLDNLQADTEAKRYNPRNAKK